MKVLVKSLRALFDLLLSGMAVSFVVSLFSFESHNWTPIIILAIFTVAWWLVMCLIAELDPLNEY